jgi:hypothetical protein
MPQDTAMPVAAPHLERRLKRIAPCQLIIEARLQVRCSQALRDRVDQPGELDAGELGGLHASRTPEPSISAWSGSSSVSVGLANW